MKRLLFILLLAGTTASGEVSLAPLFGDHAVLQRDKPVPVWGKAAPGERVTVSFANHTRTTVAATDGRWQIMLPAMAANAAPAELVVKGGNTLTRKDILVGEVWLISGQSNMEMTVKNTEKAEQAIAEADQFPLFRRITIARQVSGEASATVSGKWLITSSETTAGFSAVGYYFGRHIQQNLRVPVGIINSSYGGTPVESWIGEETYKTIPALANDVRKRWGPIPENYPKIKADHARALASWTERKAAALAEGKPFAEKPPVQPRGPDHPKSPSGLYNGMIYPLAPYALRGFLWYQGEDNAGRAEEYHPLFAAMIGGWRESFAQGDLPFYWVQLPNFRGNDSDGTAWAFLREAQIRTLGLPNTGQVVTIDIGNPNDIHPRNKQGVGDRLARLALAQTYGETLVSSGPVLDKAFREGSAYRLTFKHTDGGLNSGSGTVTGFEIAGADHRFVPADAIIKGNTVIVTSKAVAEPVAVRYCWRNAPAAGLWNGAGLPAAPFRTDDWK